MNNMSGIKKFFKKRNMKYGANSLIMIVAVVGIALMINFLFSNFEFLKNMKLDLTPNKVYSIGDTSKSILKDVDKDITIYGMFDDAKSSDVNTVNYKGVVELLSKYDSYNHIKVIYKDPVKNPGIIKEIDPNNLKSISRGNVVVKCGDRIKSLTFEDLFDYQVSSDGTSFQITGFKAEEAITSGIKYVSASKTPIAYFLTGHEEEKIDSGFTKAKEYIEKNNYEVKTLDLRTIKKVPDDAAIVAFLSPKKDITVSEREKLKDYLKAGGNAVFLFDYLEQGVPFDQFNNLLSDYNLSVDNDIIKENDNSKNNPENPYMFFPDVQSSEVTAGLNSNASLVMYQARSISLLKNAKEYITVTELAKTSDQAEGQQVDKTSGPNLTGPLDVAVAVESKAYSKPSKILVFGNSQFISDSIYSYDRGGFEFILSTLNWMQNNKDAVDIAPKTNVDSSMILSASQTTMLTWGTVVILPIIILALGTVVWVRRRHL